MPPARSATAAPRRQPRSRPRPAKTQVRPSDTRTSRTRTARTRTTATPLRIRWDRVGRVVLVVVLVVVAALYVQQALAYFSARSQADRQHAIVLQLKRQNAHLLREQRALNDPATIQRDARELGMIRPGERPYVITGLGGQ